MEFGQAALAWSRPLAELAEALARQLPRIAAALALVLVGWLVAKLARRWLRGLVDRASRLIPGRKEGASAAEARMERLASEAAGALIFWLVLLFFVAAAVETLGVSVLTSGLASLGRYLPTVLAATLVFVAGVVASNFVRVAVVSAASSAAIGRPELLGRIAKVVVLTVSVLVALDQAGIDSTLLIELTTTVVGVALAGLALAFGLGARTAVSNVIGTYYATRLYRPGQRLRIGAVEGRLVDLTPTGLLLETDEGRVLLPGKEVPEQGAVLLREADDERG